MKSDMENKIAALPTQIQVWAARLLLWLDISHSRHISVLDLSRSANLQVPELLCLYY